ncbi:MAG: hypothetical protein KDA96_02800 [Planctomycetaceae bacterium]|nr:hypothetical protein [Planctomycetaceae bacterium]
MGSMFYTTPAGEFSELIVTGRDRAKFLHNFCTNNISALTEGHASEVFFTDVKARILGHGYILADRNQHRVWMIGGYPETLFKHLDRYIITEDVQVTRNSSVNQAIFLVCPDHGGEQGTIREIIHHFPKPLSVAAIDLTGQSQSAMSLNWNAQTIILIPATADDARIAEQRLSAAGATQLTRASFDRLRLEERFPIVGLDVTDSNLAPEANRNVQAISYTKGCYLGQEPIARIDSMGHINRSLQIIGCSASSAELCGRQVQLETGETQGQVTSAAETETGAIALCILPVAITAPLRIVMEDGRSVAVERLAPRQLD